MDFTAEVAHLPRRVESQLLWGGTAIHEVKRYKRYVHDGEESYWPHSVRYVVLDAQKRKLVEREYTIEAMKLNKPLGAVQFSFPHGQVDNVYDEDAQVMIQTKKDLQLPAALEEIPGDATIGPAPTDPRQAGTRRDGIESLRGVPYGGPGATSQTDGSAGSLPKPGHDVSGDVGASSGSRGREGARASAADSGSIAHSIMPWVGAVLLVLGGAVIGGYVASVRARRKRAAS